MTLHAGAAAVEQDRAFGPPVDGAVNGARDSWRHRDEDDLGALAEHPDNRVAVFFAEIRTVQPCGLHDPEWEPTDQAYECEVVRVRRQLASVELGFELQVAQAEGGRQRGDWWTPDMFGGGTARARRR